jgi:hypothetical protein
MFERVDHLVYAVPDLAKGTSRVADLCGVAPAAGGSHPGWGTANALLSLGPRCYLEIIGPDPAQPDFEGPRPFGVTLDSQPRLCTWAANGTGLERLHELALPGGDHIGQAFPASRESKTGGILNWILTDPTRPIADGLVPFFIDWGETPHPAKTAPQGVTLIDFHLEHPRPEPVQEALRVLALDLRVFGAASPALVATLQGPQGTVILR